MYVPFKYLSGIRFPIPVFPIISGIAVRAKTELTGRLSLIYTVYFVQCTCTIRDSMLICSPVYPSLYKIILMYFSSLTFLYNFSMRHVYGIFIIYCTCALFVPQAANSNICLNGKFIVAKAQISAPMPTVTVR
jgi:hypothetical protein